jgi:hypothetical protein
MKRNLLLASAGLFLLAAAGWAQVPYIFKAGTESGKFSVTRGAVAVATDDYMDDAIDKVRETSFGEPITIQFGDGGANALDVDNRSIYVVRSAVHETKWGAITLTGSITSTRGMFYILDYDSDTIPFNVTSKLNIKSTGNSALAVYGNIALTITGGQMSTTADGTPVLRVLSGEAPRVKITGGEFEAKGQSTALDVSGGVVSIADTSVKITVESSTRAAVEIWGGSVELGGGTIINKETSGNAVKLYSQSGALTFKGSASPKITGSIETNAAGTIRADASFKPGTNKYTLKLIGSACADGAAAVKGGGANLAAFVLTNRYYELKENEGDVIVKLKAGVTQPKYVVIGSEGGEFNALLGKDTIGSGTNIGTVFDSIRVNADGRPCGIQFGGGGDAVLNLGNAGISFGSNGWGRVSISGKAVSENSRGSVLNLNQGVSIENGADISIGGSYGGIGVFIAPGADFTHKSGHIKAGIDNYGTLTISGGTVGDTLNRRDYTIGNSSSGELVINGTANIVSNDSSETGGTIRNSGTLVISGGKVSNVSSIGHSVAVLNGVWETDTTAKAVISGTAEVSSRAKSLYGVVHNKNGSMEIYGGKVYSVEDTVQIVVRNSTPARMLITGNADIKSEAKVLRSCVVGNYSVLSGKDTATASLEISGGKISANSRYAVLSEDGAKSSVSGSANITSAYKDGVIYVGRYGSRLYLLDGTVSSTYAVKDSAVTSITVYSGGNGGSAGSLFIGGSPTLTGSIRYQGEGAGNPITVQASGAAVFSPGTKKYNLLMKAYGDSVILKNGARFIQSFVLDTVGNTGITLAAKGNDAVAVPASGQVYTVSFSLNGATGTAAAPSPLLVVSGAKLGEQAMPSTAPYSKNGFKNDGEWHIRTGTSNGTEIVGEVFKFSLGADGTPITSAVTLTLEWTTTPISVLNSNREIPATSTQNAVAIAPAVVSAGELTVGPNPTASQYGKVNFFWNGTAIKAGKLSIFDAAGKAVNKITINDNAATGKRQVASWNLTDSKGRRAVEGTYVAKGVIKTKSGKSEKVSILIGIR